MSSSGKILLGEGVFSADLASPNDPLSPSSLRIQPGLREVVKTLGFVRNISFD
jgi:hypothetical protein